MTKRVFRHSALEAWQLAIDIYDRVIKPQLSKEHIGLYLAIDVDSAEYELDKDDRTACDRLYERCHNAQPFLLRVGYPAADKLGGGWPAGSGESLECRRRTITEPNGAVEQSQGPPSDLPPNSPAPSGGTEMRVRGPRHSPEEFARRGKDIYQRVIKPTLTREAIGLFLAIDIESETYVLDKDDRAACDRLYERCPDAQPVLMRVGYPATHKLGGSWPAGSGESL